MKITLIRKEGEVADCVSSPTPLHKGAFFQFLFRWIHYCHSSKSTGKETGKTHLCALVEFFDLVWREKSVVYFFVFVVSHWYSN